MVFVIHCTYGYTIRDHTESGIILRAFVKFQHGSGMIKKKDMTIRLLLLSLENVRALVGIEVKLGQT